jgi:WD40 repeat protein
MKRLGPSILVLLALGAPARAEPNARVRWVKQWGEAPLVLDGAISDVGFAERAPIAYAVSGDSGSVRVFDVPGRKTRLYLPQDAVLPEHPKAALTPDGRAIAVTVFAGNDTEIRLFDTGDGHEVQRLAAPGSGPLWEALAISRDGKSLFAVHNSVGMFAWDLASGKRLWHRPRATNGGRITEIGWLPNNRSAVLFEVATKGDTPTLIDAFTGNELARFAGRRWKGEVSHDGATLLGLNEQNIDLFRSSDRALLRTIPGGESPWVLSAAFSADGKNVFASGASKVIREIDVSSGHVSRIFQGHSGSVDALATSRDGRYLLSGSDDRSVRLWDLKLSREVPRPFGHAGGVLELARAADGDGVLSAGMDGEVRVYGVDGAPRGAVRPAFVVLDRSPARAAAFQIAGLRFFVSDAQGVSCRDLDTGRLLWFRPLNLSDRVLLDVNDHGEVLVASGKVGYVLDVRDGIERRRFTRGKVQSARFLAGSRSIVWSDRDHPLEIVDSASGRTVTKLSGHRGPAQRDDGTGVVRLVKNAALAVDDAAVSPDGRVLATTSDEQLGLWTLPGGGNQKTLHGRAFTHAQVTFSPDGRWLIAANDFGIITLVDVARARELATLDLKRAALKNQEFAPSSILFLPNGRNFIVGTRGGSLFELELEML